MFEWALGKLSNAGVPIATCPTPVRTTYSKQHSNYECFKSAMEHSIFLALYCKVKTVIGKT